jgi:death-on-curing protein
VSAAEPRWLRIEAVLAIHEIVLRIFGGQAGLRDLGLLESALARPRNQFVRARADLAALAGAYAVGIVRAHPFLDGNKRTAFVCAVTFLEQNRRRFEAPEKEVVAQMVALAQRTLTEKEFAGWLRANSVSPKEKKRRRGPGSAR